MLSGRVAVHRERRAVDAQSRAALATSMAVSSHKNGGHLLPSEDSSGRPSLVFFSHKRTRACHPERRQARRTCFFLQKQTRACHPCFFLLLSRVFLIPYLAEPTIRVANELVDWFNMVDATYRSDLRELNELNFARFDAKLEQRLAQLETRLTKRLFGFWVAQAATTAALVLGVVKLLH